MTEEFPLECEMLRKEKIGDVKVSLLRLNASKPAHKSYQLAFEGDSSRVSFVRGIILRALEREGYNTRSQYDGEEQVLSFNAQSIVADTINPLVPDTKPLRSIALFKVMQDLSSQFSSEHDLDSAMQTERMSRQAKEEGWAMRRSKQQAESLLPTSDISEALMASLKERLAPNGYIEELEIESSAWKKAVDQAASDLQRLLIERLAERSGLGR